MMRSITFGIDRHVRPAEAADARSGSPRPGSPCSAPCSSRSSPPASCSDLRERRHHDGPAELLAHAAQLLDHRAFEVRHAGSRRAGGAWCPTMPPGQLVLQVGGVEGLRLADRQAFGLGERGEVAADFAPAPRRRCRTVWPSARRFATTRSDGGFEVPSAAPPRRALQRAHAVARPRPCRLSSARPIVQWACSSSGLSPITALIAGISVRARCGVSSPPGSLM